MERRPFVQLFGVTQEYIKENWSTKLMIFWSSNSVYNYNKTGIERLKGLNLPGKLTKGIHQK